MPVNFLHRVAHRDFAGLVCRRSTEDRFNHEASADLRPLEVSSNSYLVALWLPHGPLHAYILRICLGVLGDGPLDVVLFVRALGAAGQVIAHPPVSARSLAGLVVASSGARRVAGVYPSSGE
eukprot:CAMPEP_0180198424 /NCGR_PEP_ID=MMETSP0987-20121128/5172_1 /TAXON_ID=697907 /ORGANISM="non described non described, Strain CCMP2293" /LENGTH=121 /DNA_ID=CAMNT_0022153449 /DNA_START=453 /DNA_END=818 /DNA_ORIENTATION=-